MHPGSGRSSASSTSDQVMPPSVLRQVLRTGFPAHRRTLNRVEPSFSSTIWASFTVLICPRLRASIQPAGGHLAHRPRLAVVVAVDGVDLPQAERSFVEREQQPAGVLAVAELDADSRPPGAVSSPFSARFVSRVRSRGFDQVTPSSALVMRKLRTTRSPS